MVRRAPWEVLAAFENDDQVVNFIQSDLCCAAVYRMRPYVNCKVCGYEPHATCNLSDCPPNPRVKYSQNIKDFARKDDEAFVPSKRIWLRLTKESGIPEPPRGFPDRQHVDSMLKTSCRKEGGKNSLAMVRKYVRGSAYDAAKTKGAFVFDLSTDSEGFPYIGEGEDEDHFGIGLTSEKMLQACLDMCATGPTLFHADATFKLSDLGYPVITCGVTDKARSYQIVALFIVSHRTTDDYSQCLRSLNRLLQKLYQKTLSVTAVMGDAEDAQYNAFKEVQEFASKPYLMCYFHVLYNVRRRSRHLHSMFANIIMGSISDMHYARDENDFLCLKERELPKWRSIPELSGFANYFEKQWLNGRYTCWQIYHTPSGFAYEQPL